jgi:hypothetical protein
MKNRLTMTMWTRYSSFGSAEISKDGKKVLDKVVAILKDVKDKRIQIEGHTDNAKILGSLKKNSHQLGTLDRPCYGGRKVSGRRHRSQTAFRHRIFGIPARCRE